jgi:hypothetical protein
VSPVWSKRLDRQNPNVVKLEARAEAMANRSGAARFGGKAPIRRGLRGSVYVLYYRFEEDFGRAMAEPAVRFYDSFCREAVRLLPPPAVSTRIEAELSHWFAFLFQIRRASHHIFEFIVGSSYPAARLRAAIWQSIFTHDLRRYRRALFDRMGDVSTLATGPGTGKELVAGPSDPAATSRSSRRPSGSSSTRPKLSTP